MTQLTYDPVLSCVDVAPLRLLNPLRSPEPGRALVLVPHSGSAVTVRPGESVPSARFGGYYKAYTVDLTDHRLALAIPLLSRDVSFAFQSSVTLTCRVTDPAEVVARGIRDMSGALFEAVRRILRTVSARYDISEFHQAEQALNEAVRGLDGDGAIRLADIHVELLVDADEAAGSGREFRAVARETRLGSMRRHRHLDMMREEGVEGLLAELVEKEGAPAALAWIEKAEAAERTELFSTLKLVLERGDAEREPYEIAATEKLVMERMLGGSAAPFGGTRSRLRGSLALPAPAGLESSAPSHPADPAPDRAAALAGEVVSRRTCEPPEDEPVARPASTPPPTGGAPEPAPEPVEMTAPVSRVRGLRPRNGGGAR
ncbi:hypothetical protein C7C46_16330 [Streptomyces tateyamensis]|uniref:Band 7 domain-containing protein n=1 Tax=Streptomyces tateyamensis TaxID=565073 RepID=A0A2V4NGL6_9ACTN|nr:hypothetical protein [Streptomyces tateyamensis]PYC78402.1 hypothetical protein C7C46_16330 [Streptomyces tateyamensis]